jgi:hypothetical protein
MHRVIYAEEWEILNRCNEATAKIHSRCYQIAVDLADIFRDSSVFERLAFQIMPNPEGSNVAKIVSPFGAARLRLDWSVHSKNQPGVKELAGCLILERETLNEKDEEIWQPVWSMTVPPYDDPFSGVAPELHVISYTRAVGHQRGESLYTLGMCMLYAIAFGPQLA